MLFSLLCKNLNLFLGSFDRCRDLIESGRGQIVYSSGKIGDRFQLSSNSQKQKKQSVLRGLVTNLYFDVRVAHVANRLTNLRVGLLGRKYFFIVILLLIQIEVDDDGNIIDAKFKTFGCGSAIASSSLATEWIKGKSVRKSI